MLQKADRHVTERAITVTAIRPLTWLRPLFQYERIPWMCLISERSLALERSRHAGQLRVSMRQWLGSVVGRGSRHAAARRPRVGAGALAA